MHTGDIPSPCSLASPLGIRYREIMRLSASGKTADAARTLRECTPFGGFLSVWGDRDAEAACLRSSRGGPLQLTGMLKWLSGKEEALVYSPVTALRSRKDKKIAVIGSGAAGLQAAHDLRKNGYLVTVFEAGPAIGCTLLFQPTEGSSPAESDLLPPVPADVLQKTVAMLSAMGIGFSTSSPKGQTDLKRLRDEYDAVVCACGKGSVLPADDSGRVEGNLFAAGACMKNRKQINTLQALASGAKAAYAVSCLLEGLQEEKEGGLHAPDKRDIPCRLSEEQADMPPVQSGSGGMFSDREAREEASRCLGCGTETLMA